MKKAFDMNIWHPFSSARHRHLEAQRLAFENLVGHHFHLRIQWSPFSSVWSDGWIRGYRTILRSHFLDWKPGMSHHRILFRTACGRGKSPDFPTNLDHHRRNAEKRGIWIGYWRYGGCRRSPSLNYLLPEKTLLKSSYHYRKTSIQCSFILTAKYKEWETFLIKQYLEKELGAGKCIERKLDWVCLWKLFFWEK